MTDKELQERCLPTPYNYRIVYYSSEQYGFGKMLRKMFFYPKWLPICAHFEHSSPPFYDKMWKLNHQFLKYVFFHRRDYVTQWNTENNSKAFQFMSPFVWYKQKEKIKISKEAKGSIFFISHSSETFDNVVNEEKIMDTVANLDSEFHPVTFCFYFVDVQKNAHLRYQEKGFNIVTVGHRDSPYFIKNFYETIKEYKFMLTNSIGGHLLFGTNLGMPVSYLNNLEPKQMVDEEYEKTVLKTFNTDITPNKAKALFKGIHKTVTKEQLEFVNTMLGLKKPISRLKGSWILYVSLIYYTIFKIKKVKNAK
mgnify:CR=1 FL=1